VVGLKVSDHWLVDLATGWIAEPVKEDMEVSWSTDSGIPRVRDVAAGERVGWVL
jgi:hypothetical protein